MANKILLKVPYQERHQVKALGAEWDPITRQWMLPMDANMEPFRRWLPARSPLLRLCSPYLLTRDVTCRRCEALTRAYALGTQNFTIPASRKGYYGFFTLYAIHSVPNPLTGWFRQHCFTFYAERTNTVWPCWVNHCLCGAVLEDKRLHCLGPDGFRPDALAQAAKISIKALPLSLTGCLRALWRSNPLLKRISPTEA